MIFFTASPPIHTIATQSPFLHVIYRAIFGRLIEIVWGDTHIIDKECHPFGVLVAQPTYDLDCLFVHTPKAHNHYLPFGDFFNITYMPMGLPALANWLVSSGYTSEIIHLGVEWIQDKAYNIVNDQDGRKIHAIGLSLYWHYQTFDAIEVARALSKNHPEAFIFLGGVTASYFAEEILGEFPEIHGVLMGHGEHPVQILVETLKNGGDLGSVPNLVWQGPDGTLVNNRENTANKKSALYFGRGPDLDRLNYGDLSLLRHSDIYAKSFGFPLAWSKEYSTQENRARLNMGRPFFPLFTGRGCPYLCSFCGGNRDSLKRINGKGGVAWRSQDRVLEDIRRAMHHGYRTVSLCFDPTPTRDEYYVTLFDKIYNSDINIDMYFECWGLPTERFTRSFRRAFPNKESYLALSPDSGSELVRRANKQPYYSDSQLIDAIKLLANYEISADVFYTIALPKENLIEARKTRQQMQDLFAKYNNLRRIMVWSVQLEPGSPQFERPETFNMETDRHTFLDYYHLHGGAGGDTYSGLGFKIKDYFGDERDEGSIADFERHLQHLKCMEFCFLAPDPRDFSLPEAGRKHCFERRVSLANRRGTTPPTQAISQNFDYTDALEEEMTLRGETPREGWL